MDASLVGSLVAGVAIGWGLKACYPPSLECPPCNSRCACHHTTSSDSSNWAGSDLLLLVLVLVLAAVAANTALAFKVKLTSKGEEKEIAVSVKGKSKGIYGASRALAISG